MWTRFTGAVSLFLLASSFCFAQPWPAPISSAGRIRELASELEQNLALQESLIEQLEASNERLSTGLSEALKLLKESEASLRKQIQLSQNLGWLIEEQAIYSRKLGRKLTFWRITSGALAASLAATLIIWGVSN